MARTWIFLHIPKTGGTSFRTAVEARAGLDCHRDYARLRGTSDFVRARVYDSGEGSDSERRRRMLAELDEAGGAFLGGHFSAARYPADESLDRVVTIVREPVARVLSHYEWTCVRREPVPFEEFINRPTMSNLQTQVLAGADPAELGLIGLTEEFDQFARAFGRLTGVRVPTRYSNVSDRVGNRRTLFPKSAIDEIERLNEEDIELYARCQEIVAGYRTPTFTIVMPTFNSGAQHLTEAVESVVAQEFTDWEMEIVDDGSSEREVLRTLKGLNDPRISVTYRDRNGGISAATNDGVARARGDYLAMLDHDDLLLPGALQAVAAELRDRAAGDLIYSDQSKIDADGSEVDVFHKPAWSPTYALGVMYIGHLLVVRRDLFERAGGCDSDFDGAQDFEWFLRLSAIAESIAHIPRTLYAWRAIEGSLAADSAAKPEAADVQLRSARAHLDRTGAPGVDVAPHPRYAHRLRFIPRAGVVQPTPPVSIVIPTFERGEHLSRCLDSIQELTSYPDYEIVAVDGGSTEAAAVASLARAGVTKVEQPPGHFNFSEACNAGVESAGGEIVILLNNDTEVLEVDWIENLLLHLGLPGVGAVGPLLTYPDGTVQHAGVGIGVRGSADHLMRGFDADAEGPAGAICCAREVAAVTAAALCTRRATYRELEGMEPEFATHYQDVDFCLRLRQTGKRIVYTPHPRLLHHEGASRGETYDFIDRALLIDRHPEVRRGRDPYYNQNLSRDSGNFSPASGRPQKAEV